LKSRILKGTCLLRHDYNLGAFDPLPNIHLRLENFHYLRRLMASGSVEASIRSQPIPSVALIPASFRLDEVYLTVLYLRARSHFLEEDQSYGHPIVLLTGKVSVSGVVLDQQELKPDGLQGLPSPSVVVPGGVAEGEL
jgi:hypothetical protein